MDKIYILKKEKLMLGPYTLAELKVKGVKSTDMIWYEGLSDWTQASKLESISQFVNADIPDQKQSKKTLIDKLLPFLK